MKKRNRLNSCVFLIIVLLLSSVVSAQQNIDINVITFNYKKQPESLSLVKIEKSSGYAPEYTVSTTAYKLDIISTTDKVLKAMRFSPPVEETAFKGFTTTESTNIVKFTISIPYFSNAKIISVYDKNDKKVLDIPLKATALEKSPAQQAVQQITQKKLSEQDKVTVYTETKLSNISWVYIFPLLAILIFLMVLISLASIEIKRRKYRN